MLVSQADRRTEKRGEVGMTIATLIEKFQEDISWLGDNATEREIVKHIKCAITLLKEQEWQTKRLTPTEPNVSINEYGVKFYYCPHCQRPILKSGIFGSPRHCEDCGQAVKWE